MTTQAQIYNAKIIANDIENDIGKVIPNIVHVDDWSDYGSFRAFITLVTISRFSDLHLRKIGNIIRKVIKHGRYGAELESLVMPKRVYRRDGRRKDFYGYDGTTITIDYRVY